MTTSYKALEEPGAQHLGADVLSAWHSPQGLPVHTQFLPLPHTHAVLLP